MSEELAATVLAVVVVIAVLAALLGGYHPPRSCPAGAFLAADGFCTHAYGRPTPAPTRKP